MPKKIKVRGWPIMAAKCPSCPFREDGDIALRNSVMARTSLKASQICHHPVLKGKKETHLCRGARDQQLTILHRLGWIATATDEAFAAKSKELGIIPWKPYFEEAGVTIYHGDCREIIPSLGEVDHVITDPPYSDATHSGARTKPIGNQGPAGVLIDFNSISPEYLRAILEQCADICRRWMIGFVDWKYVSALDTEPPRSMRFVRFGVWVKPNGAPQFTGDRPAMGWEAIAIMHSDREALRWNGGGSRAVWTYPQPGGDLHPTQKPIELIMRLIDLFTDQTDTILDPFMGSGTTILAAKELGRKAIGIELEEKYCEIAANRLRQGVFNFEAAL